MRVLGITMARGGSVGVPRKNVRMIGGKPLIAWTIEEALKCTLIDRYIVSTDDEEIAGIAREYGAEVPFMEPYSDGTNPLWERIKWVTEMVEDQEGDSYDVIADLRATNPFKTQMDIDGAISKLIETGADVVCGVTKLDDHHPSRIKMVVADRLVDVWPEPPSGRRQDLTPDVYIRNGSIYIALRDALFEGIHFMGSENIRPWYMPLERSLNIDTILDFKLAEAMMGERDAVRS